MRCFIVQQVNGIVLAAVKVVNVALLLLFCGSLFDWLVGWLVG